MSIDKRTKRGRELAHRLNQQTILDSMPKVYYVEDGDRYRVGRTDEPGDYFDLVPKAEFEIFRKVYNGLRLPLIDLTNEGYDES